MVAASQHSDPHMLHWLSAAEIKRVVESARDGLALLLWKDDTDELQILHLRPDTEYFVGRGEDMSIPITWDGRVSGLHAKLTCAGGEWLISDDGWSKNGTFVNETPIGRSERLRERDVIRVGRTKLIFRSAVAVRGMPFTTTDTRSREVPSFDDVDRAILVELCRPFFVGDSVGQFVSLPNKEIAQRLHLAEDTISARLRKMYGRAGIAHGKNANRTALMQLAIENGVVTARDYESR